MNISKWISLLQNQNQHSSIRKGKDIKVYCNTEENRVNEGKTGGRHKLPGAHKHGETFVSLGHQPTTPPHSEPEFHSHQLRHYKTHQAMTRSKK
jgi:hypothetical protein